MHRIIVTALCAIVAGCGGKSAADPKNEAQVAAGKRVYEEQCASCHGARREGQANWRERRPDGRLPAPFAPSAGWGDVAVGAFALPVALMAAHRAAGR